jgi:spore coat protein JB
MMSKINHELNRKMQQIDFALHETALYLDVHPENTQALNYYKKLMAARLELEKELISQKMPITYRDVRCERWNWVDGPWPWQNEV